jgi:hypothetical protein
MGSVLRSGAVAGEGRGVDQTRLGTYLLVSVAGRDARCYVSRRLSHFRSL